MSKITGLKKYFCLMRGMINRRMTGIPPAFIIAMFTKMKNEKLTRLGSRYHVNTHYAPFPSNSYNASLELFSKIKKGDFSPLSVYFSVTDRCINKCVYCSNHRNNPGKDIDAGQIIDAIRQVQDTGAVTIGFTGGEPLMRDDLEKLISSVNNRSYTVLFTSGNGLTGDRVSRLKESGLTVASVSIDSQFADEQNSRRGSENAYSDALNAISLFSDAGIYTTASAVMSSGMKSWNELENFADFLYTKGANELRILREIPSGKACGSSGLFDHEKVEALRKLYNKRQDKITIMSLPGFESPGYSGCGAGLFHLYIDAAGNVCPCDFVQTPFGNLAVERFSEIYKRMKQIFRFNSDECLSVRMARGDKISESDCKFHGLLKSLVKDNNRRKIETWKSL